MAFERRISTVPERTNSFGVRPWALQLASRLEEVGPDAFSKNGRAHDFSRLRVNAPADTAARLPELSCSGLLHQGHAGDTRCDASVGTPTTVIYSPSLCYKVCTERHEAVHASDLGSCCNRANKAYQAAPTDEKKTAVQDRMNQWVLNNQAYFECRGYTESVKCGEELKAADCRAPSSAGSESSSGEKQAETAAETTATQAAGTEGESKRALVSELLPEASLAEEKPADAPFDPQLCCSAVKEYVRKQTIHRDAWCKAEKNPTACPFPASLDH